ncbi:PREDICTED: uncharacterized protein LOC105361492 [Ceratosolen solmsi marchali]|uniref:poly(ADP-ribose) glycohydrolase n=1 Tax=Ceratosolen solmsi marchali TaxID=326594 RepID=A0AAJ6YFA9_9HYME|nr:PREDICTED: uncharacterized protein LOC105361492 [Ceratosolen solmsi marchali]
MALVMLPCDLPWWSTVTKQLDKAAAAKNSEDLVDAMQRVHDMCNLDPEEDLKEPDLFIGLVNYLEKELNSTERNHIFTKTIPYMVNRAKILKIHKPPQGLYFSLQQQGDTIEHSYAFVASLIANAFFSTYPKRTPKTHPTLMDFNFTNFFKYLHLKSQRAKLRGLFQYFDYLEYEGERALEGHLLISRQVMLSKQWLTIEDWLECSMPLCPLSIRHEGRLERAKQAGNTVMQVCFASRNLGNGVLEDSVTQETIQIATHPELLAIILSVEALEDNEALIVEGLRHISRIQDPKHRATFEIIPEPNSITICCIDAEDYSQLPLAQYEEDNVLRELNKSLLGFRQRRPLQNLIDYSASIGSKQDVEQETVFGIKRLSPIGESCSSVSPEIENISNKREVTINNTNNQESGRQSITTEIIRENGSSNHVMSPGRIIKISSVGRRNNFIVLGSSGEALPITRKSIAQTSVYNSCNSESTDSFYSATDTIDEELENEDENQQIFSQYSSQLDNHQWRETFVQRLKDVLKHENSTTGTKSTSESASDSSYAVGISIAGSQVGDQNIKIKRGGSRGFVLRNETVDEEFLKESLEVERKWLGRFRQNQLTMINRKETGINSRNSFSTDYSSEFCSELEEVYEQLSKWLEDPILLNSENRELNARDKAVVTFASSLLKRALSESFAGVPVQEGEPQPFFNASDAHQRHKLALVVRSLSLELARQKSRQQSSISRESSPQIGDLLPVATGNWGCGSRLKGDPQLKLIVQWLAASIAGVPRLIYYTFSHSKLTKLDTVSRVLTDRQWSVGDLAAATLRFSLQTIEETLEGSNSLFEELIGIDKPSF